MRLALVDPEIAQEITIETSEAPVTFTGVFRRVSRKEQNKLVRMIDGWSSLQAPIDATQTLHEQETLLVDLLLRFEDLPVEDDDFHGEPSPDVLDFIHSLGCRTVMQRHAAPLSMLMQTISEADEAAEPAPMGFYQPMFVKWIKQLDSDALKAQYQTELDEIVEDVLANEARLRFVTELALVMDDPLVFTKLSQAAIRAVVNAGLERSKN